MDRGDTSGFVSGGPEIDCMDGSPIYSVSLTSVSTHGDKVVGPKVVLGLYLDSPDMLGTHLFNGKKGYCNTINRSINPKDGSSLVLGLGPSTSFHTTIGSAKELEDESSIDLGLSIDLNIGGNWSSHPKKVLAGTSNTKIRLASDLHLSLSTVTAESDVTTLNQGFAQHHEFSDSPVIAPAVQLVEDGSTSSCRKVGPLVPPFLKSQLECSRFVQESGGGKANLVDLNIPSTALVPSSVVGCASCVVDECQQRKSNVKTCQFEGCTRGARGASGLCIAHGGGRRCQRVGCQKGAEGRTVFCKAHGGGRRCQHLGCTKSAEGRTDYCIAHGGGRRCSHEGCVRAARGRSGLCIRHGGGKRCKIEDCTKSAEGISGLCISHGGGRRCQFPECAKGAQGGTMFCKAHGGGRRCSFWGCTKGAEGSTPFCKGHGGGKRCTSEGCTKSVHGGTLFCVSHGGGKRCAVPDCTKSARGRTSHCVRHGGGKRCKFEGCPKSAQGSTDFCKAHGGGKRCSWGQFFSEFRGHSTIPCDKFARGKSGLCSAHSAQMLEKLTPESLEAAPMADGPNSVTSTPMEGIVPSGTSMSFPKSSYNNWTTTIASVGHGYPSKSPPAAAHGNFMAGASPLNQFSLPEGRVHGGSLMAMLTGRTTIGSSSDTKGDGKYKSLSQRWT